METPRLDTEILNPVYLNIDIHPEALNFVCKLNGQIMHWAKEANTEEGWVRISPHLGGGWFCDMTFYGKVELVPL